MNYTDLERLVLKHVQSDPLSAGETAGDHETAGATRIAASGGPQGDQTTGQKGSHLAYGSNHLVYAAPSATAQGREVVGVFQRTSGGFGFVKPRSRDAATRARRWISTSLPATPPMRPRATWYESGWVDHEVLVARRSRGVRSSKCCERETHQFVGTYKPRGDAPQVQVDGNVFSQPIPVGDPGAKNVRPEDKVVIEMVRFPSHRSEGEAVITEVLGPRGTPGVDTLTIIREYGLPEDFPEDVLEAARQQADRIRANATWRSSRSDRPDGDHYRSGRCPRFR